MDVRAQGARVEHDEGVPGVAEVEHEPHGREEVRVYCVAPSCRVRHVRHQEVKYEPCAPLERPARRGSAGAGARRARERRRRRRPPRDPPRSPGPPTEPPAAAAAAADVVRYEPLPRGPTYRELDRPSRHLLQRDERLAPTTETAPRQRVDRLPVAAPTSAGAVPGRRDDHGDVLPELVGQRDLRRVRRHQVPTRRHRDARALPRASAPVAPRPPWGSAASAPRPTTPVVPVVRLGQPPELRAPHPGHRRQTERHVRLEQAHQRRWRAWRRLRRST